MFKTLLTNNLKNECGWEGLNKNCCCVYKKCLESFRKKCFFWFWDTTFFSTLIPESLSTKWWSLPSSLCFLIPSHGHSEQEGEFEHNSFFLDRELKANLEISFYFSTLMEMYVFIWYILKLEFKVKEKYSVSTIHKLGCFLVFFS